MRNLGWTEPKGVSKAGGRPKKALGSLLEFFFLKIDRGREAEKGSEGGKELRMGGGGQTKMIL